MTIKLYELTEEFANIVEAIEDEEISPEAVKDTLESLEFPIQEKFDNIGKLLKNYEASVKVLKEEEQRLNKKRKTLENKIESIKDYSEYNLRNMNRDSVHGDIFKVTRQRNPPSYEYDERSIARKYFIPQEPKLDKKTLAEDYKNGKKVRGIKKKEDTYHVRFR